MVDEVLGFGCRVAVKGVAEFGILTSWDGVIGVSIFGFSVSVQSSFCCLNRWAWGISGFWI